MPWEPFDLTREAIYKAVWSASMRDAAKKFGISDVALGKVCRKLNVPRPKQGYWLRRSLGQVPPTKPLPQLQSGQPDRHEGRRWREPKRSTPDLPESVRGAVQPIVVPANVEKLHPCLQRSLSSMRKLATNIWEYRRWNGSIPILASEASLDRALRIMNALMLALESLGHRIETKPESERGQPWHRAQNGVHVGDVFVGFSMFERWTMVRQGRPPERRRDETPEEACERVFWRAVRYVPNGKLAIRVHDEYGLHREWTDKKKQKIEGILHEVIPEILAEAEAIRTRRVEHARAAEVERERQRQLAEAEKRRKREDEEVVAMRKMLADWQEVRDIRAFIAEARAIVGAAGLVIREESNLADFIRWASDRAERIDPLRLLRQETREKAAAAVTSIPQP